MSDICKGLLGILQPTSAGGDHKDPIFELFSCKHRIKICEGKVVTFWYPSE
jgi:hypothetical protein